LAPPARGLPYLYIGRPGIKGPGSVGPTHAGQRPTLSWSRRLEQHRTLKITCTSLEELDMTGTKCAAVWFVITICHLEATVGIPLAPGGPRIDQRPVGIAGLLHDHEGVAPLRLTKLVHVLMRSRRMSGASLAFYHARRKVTVNSFALML
jgi:hypothetical protein